jgi:hypothetical protein
MTCAFGGAPAGGNPASRSQEGADDRLAVLGDIDPAVRAPAAAFALAETVDDVVGVEVDQAALVQQLVQDDGLVGQRGGRGVLREEARVGIA